MAEYYNDPFLSEDQTKTIEKEEKTKILIPLLLFVLTFITTTIAGVEWRGIPTNGYEIHDLLRGLPYSCSIMFFLGVHEFGHYFASRYHQVKTSLPYFIPFIFIDVNFGTLGAVIRTRTQIPSKKALFDIGASGPIAGFFAALGILIYGLTHLPGKEYLMAIHPDYGTAEYGKNAISLIFGDTLIFSFLKSVLTSPADFVPPMGEIYHYPYLCVGWFALFVTSMNLIPVGQLDGGHIFYALFGEKKHYHVASISMIILIVLGFLGILRTFVWTWIPIGFPGWLVWSIILYFVIKIKHPPVYDYVELDPVRNYLGYFAMFIFIICFSPTPFLTY